MSESSFNPNAIKNGNYGLMQINARLHKERCGVTDKKQFFDPEINIKCGCSYLEFQHKRYNGNMRKTLYAYNKGNADYVTKEELKNSSYVNGILKQIL